MAETRDELSEEVHRLLTAVQDWARRFPEARADAEAHAAGAGECLPWCPICQFANVLRGDHPEVTERLTEAANAVASAMKALADVALTRAQPESARHRRPKPVPRVEHIRLDDPLDS
jgi:hypothetical protein